MFVCTPPYPGQCFILISPADPLCLPWRTNSGWSLYYNGCSSVSGSTYNVAHWSQLLLLNLKEYILNLNLLSMMLTPSFFTSFRSIFRLPNSSVILLNFSSSTHRMTVMCKSEVVKPLSVCPDSFSLSPYFLSPHLSMPWIILVTSSNTFLNRIFLAFLIKFKVPASPYIFQHLCERLIAWMAAWRLKF